MQLVHLDQDPWKSIVTILAHETSWSELVF